MELYVCKYVLLYVCNPAPYQLIADSWLRSLNTLNVKHFFDSIMSQTPRQRPSVNPKLPRTQDIPVLRCARSDIREARIDKLLAAL